MSLIGLKNYKASTNLTNAQKNIVEEEVPAISLALKLAKDTTLIFVLGYVMHIEKHLPNRAMSRPQ